MEKIFYITDFGATTESDDNAKYIQAGIDSLEKGGTLVVPAGEFVTGALSLKSDIHIILEAGAVIKAHKDINKYVMNGFYDSFGNETNSFITAYNCENITISGDGKIDMQGCAFVDFEPSDSEQSMPSELYQQTPAKPLNRPRRPILFSDCKNIRIRNIKIEDAPCWTITFHNSENIKINSVSVKNNPRIPHNDGLHFTACKKVIVNDCDFVCGDDCIAITSLFDYSLPTDGIIISNCHMSSRSAAIRVGHISSRVKNVVISNIVIENTNRGIAIFAGDDGCVENVKISNIIMETQLYHGGWWGKGEPIVICTYNSTGSAKKITFDGVFAKSENSVIVAGNNMSDIKFRDCSFDIDFDKYTADSYELSPNGLAERTVSQTEIVNISDTKIIIE